VVLGDSLGGLNALQLLFWGNLNVDKLVLICPAISVANPFESKELATDLDSQNANAFLRIGYRTFLKSSYKNLEVFQKNSAMDGLLKDTSFFSS